MIISLDQICFMVFYLFEGLETVIFIFWKVHEKIMFFHFLLVISKFRLKQYPPYSRSLASSFSFVWFKLSQSQQQIRHEALPLLKNSIKRVQAISWKIYGLDFKRGRLHLDLFGFRFEYVIRRSRPHKRIRYLYWIRSRSIITEISCTVHQTPRPGSMRWNWESSLVCYLCLNNNRRWPQLLNFKLTKEVLKITSFWRAHLLPLLENNQMHEIGAWKINCKPSFGQDLKLPKGAL